MKKVPLFWKVYIGVLTLCLLAMFTLFIFLWDFLRFYEKTESKYEMDKVIVLLKEHNYADLLPHIEYKVSEFETEEILVSYLEQVSKEPDLKYYQKSGSKENPRYVIYKENQDIAAVSLKKTGETKYDFPVWAIEKIDDINLKTKEISITVPENTEVTVNGIVLPEIYAVRKNIEAEELKNIKDYFQAPVMKEYKITGLTKDPVIVVKDKVTQTELEAVSKESGVLRYDFGYSREIAAETENSIIEISKIYCNYVTNDAEFEAIQPYLLRGTPTYTKMTYIAESHIWYAPHDRVEFQDMRVYNYKQYTEDCYSCEITFLHRVHRLGTVFEYPTHLKYYFIKTGDKWYIADLQTK